MRKIVAGLFVSLDGVFEAPEQWHSPYFNDEMMAEIQAQAEESDVMLLGRKTYQEFADFWPNQSGDDPFIAYINNTPKYVVSSTLRDLAWQNSTLIDGGNVAAELTKLKQQSGKTIAITGSGTLVRTLLRDGLLDELRLLVHPIALGRGKRLFPDGYAQTPLKLAAAKTLSTGVLALVYQPAGSTDDR